MSLRSARDQEIINELDSRRHDPESYHRERMRMGASAAEIRGDIPAWNELELERLRDLKQADKIALEIQRPPPLHRLDDE